MEKTAEQEIHFMKLDPTFDRDRPWLWMKFRAPEFDPATGMDYEELKAQGAVLQRS